MTYIPHKIESTKETLTELLEAIDLLQQYIEDTHDSVPFGSERHLNKCLDRMYGLINYKRHQMIEENIC